jgi:hypothetical protein
MCSGQCSGQPKDSKQINCYLMPTQSILMTDQTITCETPLMNGIYYTSFTNQVQTDKQTNKQTINFDINQNIIFIIFRDIDRLNKNM